VSTVSILIPAYNAERWLSETIQSALNQTWQDLEVVIVDDGSTDRTLAIARSFESSRVKVLHQENKGPGATRNVALRSCGGDFVQYLDHDDLLSPDKIESQVDRLRESPPGMLAVSAAVYFQDGTDPQSGVLADGWPMVDSDDPLGWLIELLGPDGEFGMVPPGAWLTPRSLALEAGPWDEEPTPDDDGEYFARVVLKSAGIRRSKTGTFFFRKHGPGGSVSTSRTEVLLSGALRSTDRKANLILSRTGDARAKRALANAYMYRAVEAYPDFPEIARAALSKVEELGGTDFVPPLGGWRSELVGQLLGWRAAKKASTGFQQMKAVLNRPARRTPQ
jgi:glycosyltransferase involved in cell wall biosynthesis